MKPPYDKKIVVFLQGNIENGLKGLKDTGKRARWINYEDLCIDAKGSTHDIVFIEWHSYWNHWYDRFRDELTHTKRKGIFKELITDLIRRGLLPSKTSGLTGNISSMIENLVSTEREEETN